MEHEISENQHKHIKLHFQNMHAKYYFRHFLLKTDANNSVLRILPKPPDEY